MRAMCVKAGSAGWVGTSVAICCCRLVMSLRGGALVVAQSAQMIGGFQAKVAADIVPYSVAIYVCNDFGQSRPIPFLAMQPLITYSAAVSACKKCGRC